MKEFLMKAFTSCAIHIWSGFNANENQKRRIDFFSQVHAFPISSPLSFQSFIKSFVKQFYWNHTWNYYEIFTWSIKGDFYRARTIIKIKKRRKVKNILHSSLCGNSFVYVKETMKMKLLFQIEMRGRFNCLNF